jgi:hypothetical protein
VSLYKELERTGLLDFFIALVLNAGFLVVITLALWAAGRVRFAASLAIGYSVFWPVVIIVSGLQRIILRRLRIDTDSNFDAFLISNAAVSAILLIGWSAFAALSAGVYSTGLSLWKAGMVYLFGSLSSWFGFNVVAPFYSGSFYRTINAPLSVLSFAVFAFWPAAARLLFGWFFGLFGFQG